MIPKLIICISLFLLSAIPASGFKEVRSVMVVMLFIVPLFVLCFTKSMYNRDYSKLVLPLISICFLLIFSLNGLIQGSTDLQVVIQAFTVYLSFFIIYHSAQLAVSLNILTPISITRSILFGTIIFNMLKFIILLAIATQFFALSTVVEYIHIILGAAVIEYYDPSALTSRISLANDLLSVIFLCLFVSFDKFTAQVFGALRFAKNPVIVILIAGIIYSFTRYFWILSVVVVISKLFTNPKALQRSAKYISAAIVSGVIAIFILSDTWFFKIASARFGDLESVSMKQDQSTALLSAANSEALALLFGKGLGAYVYDFIRSDYQLFMYEVQLASFVYQFGIIGTIFIMSYLAYLSYGGVFNFVDCRISKNFITFFLIVVLLLASSLTNPYLLTSYCALAWLLLNSASSIIFARRTTDV